jgi:predicted nucleotidyltransferase
MMRVLDRLREATSAAFEGTQVLFAYLFGSQATGRTHHWSDVDIAVYMEPGWDGDRLEAMLDFARRVEDSARVGNVEVLVLNGAPLRLQGRVIRQGNVIYSRDEPGRVAWESRTFREFVDFEYHGRQMDLEHLRAIAEGKA